MARLADWEKDTDPLWPLQRAERSALVTLNVPHFVSASDASEIGDIERHIGPHAGALRPAARARPRAWHRCEGNRLADRGDPARTQNSNGTEPRRNSRESRGRHPGKRHFRRGSRAHRRGTVPAGHSPRAKRRLDRARLAGRLPRRSSSFASGPISTTASPALRCFSPRTRRRPARRISASSRLPASPTCARA